MAQEGGQQTELASAASYLRTLLLKNPRGPGKPEEITVSIVRKKGETMGVEDETTAFPRLGAGCQRA